MKKKKPNSLEQIIFQKCSLNKDVLLVRVINVKKTQKINNRELDIETRIEWSSWSTDSKRKSSDKLRNKYIWLNRVVIHAPINYLLNFQPNS